MKTRNEVAREMIRKAERQPKAAKKESASSKRAIGKLPAAYIDWEKELRLQIAARKEIPTPNTEFVFHPLRKWRFDFAWPTVQLAVEIQGGVFGQGRHTQGKGYTEDCEKMAEAVCLGWRVMYVTSEQVKNGQALRWVERALGSVER